MKELLDTWYQQSGQISPVRIPKLDRKRLVQLFGEHGLTEGAEIGVDRGRFSEYMFKVIPDLHLYCVDPWRWKLRGESRYNSTVTRLTDRNATIIRKDAMDARYDVPDESLDFVYIDGDHLFDAVVQDIIAWMPKIKLGGIMALHDYHTEVGADVMMAINAYTHCHDIRPWYVTREQLPSAYWVKK